MAITYTGTNGLFTRLGKLFYVRKLMNDFQDNLRTEIEDVLDEFTVTDMYQTLNLPSSIKTFDAPMMPMHSSIAGIAQNIIMETVRSGLSKEPQSFKHAMELLIQDMVAESKTVEAAAYGTAGTIAAGGSNTGNGTILVNSSQPRTYQTTDTTWQTIKPEVLTIECKMDKSSGTALGREHFSIIGDEPKNSFNAEWPAGSGVQEGISVTAAKSAGSFTRGVASAPGNNILRNSDFQTFAATTLPLGWVDAGSGSHSGNKQEANTTAAYIWNAESSGNVQLNGNGSFQHKLTQQLRTNSGTPASVYGGKNYILSCRTRIAAGSGTVGSGVLEFNIQSGSGSKVSSATKSYNLSSLGTSWVHITDNWNFTETELPKDPYFSIECTTAIANTKNIVIDELVLAEVVPVYSGGPGILIVRGSADFRNKDVFTCTWAHGASPPANEMQFMFEQLLGISGMGLNLPTSGSPNIADSLIA
ncbi:MAG: hypothetical protein GOVbin1630_2 [Prokaryotic dsDNA virus sp.]|nr:MAG: hypothetical protein GOVbin1630_2 [Prokaryotic dsDNA virus sp.]|tara:strand:+ start:24144 stop:25562 length:1419 start_codon:yes stop_codon:yes gene_type:complete